MDVVADNFSSPRLSVSGKPHIWRKWGMWWCRSLSRTGCGGSTTEAYETWKA